MKKLALIFILMVFLISLTACGNEGKKEISSDAVRDTPKNESYESPESGETAPDSLPILTSGNIVVFGHYEQDNNTNNGMEPIEWIVLETKEDQLWLVSRYGLDTKPFGEGLFGYDWQNSTLRDWLNDGFYNQAFSDEEKESIRESVVLNNENEIHKESRSKFFLLSREEVNSVPGSERICKITKYAENVDSYFSDGNGSGYWWTRTWRNDYGKYSVYVVDYEGQEGSKWEDQLLYVRPSMWVSKEAVTLSKGEDGTPVMVPVSIGGTTSDEIPEYCQGVVQNNTYENKYLGIGFSYSGWEIKSEKEMEEIRESDRNGNYSVFSERGAGEFDTVIKFTSSDKGTLIIRIIKPAQENRDEFLKKQQELAGELMEAFHLSVSENTLTKCRIDGKEEDMIMTTISNNSQYYRQALYKTNDLWVNIVLELGREETWDEVLSRLYWVK